MAILVLLHVFPICLALFFLAPSITLALLFPSPPVPAAVVSQNRGHKVGSSDTPHPPCGTRLAFLSREGYQVSNTRGTWESTDNIAPVAFFVAIYVDMGAKRVKGEKKSSSVSNTGYKADAVTKQKQLEQQAVQQSQLEKLLA